MTKINQVVSNWPRNTIKTVKELTEMGLYPSLLKMYSNSKWIQLYMRGMYKLYNDEVSWQGLLYGLQKNDNLIHAGGKTALELKGYGHYLKQGEVKVYLFSTRNVNFNLWLKKFKNLVLKRTEVFDYTNKNYFTNFNKGSFEIKISAPELAFMEMLYLIPAEQEFDEAFKIMEGLTSLRPNLVQSLLENCSSIKIKRLFLFMAEKSGHEWFHKLKPNAFDLGAGKRMIVKEGVLNKAYGITIPKDYEG